VSAAGGWDADFPVARCARCARDVLTHLAVDDAGDERRRCIHCDAEMDPEEVRWVEEAALEPLGYGVHGAEAGCGRPGCGKGTCGRQA
jgi:hypothetical protein